MVISPSNPPHTGQATLFPFALDLIAGPPALAVQNRLLPPRRPGGYDHAHPSPRPCPVTNGTQTCHCWRRRHKNRRPTTQSWPVSPLAPRSQGDHTKADVRRRGAAGALLSSVESRVTRGQASEG